ncbi:hypothetical protein RHGRI_011885 [Rhododendron griersonianum]|uniref:Neprosin activation peptide domain-containing protein n=1 Tax=Rhododendron griersonianum TaxID=479676 RepID=A0AAV6KPW5_9ERIC|nr:hypothetical protein RHGRI_011885 [Rhododendron griersonianum]
MQLKLLNKPAVKTIHTEYGDIIDCVDFYKQPAFDHPLLKNHTFHYGMKPSTPFHVGARDQDSSNFTKPVSIGLKGGGCPIGTVPIRRITKEDLIRERLSSRTMSSDDNTPGAHYAVARTRSGSNKFLGAGAQEISLHNPHASGSQYSAAKIKIQNGPDSIEVGWRVSLSNFLYLTIGSRRVDSFFGPIAVLNEYGQTVDPDNVEEFADNKKLYNVRNKGIEKDFGRVILYGGRGGSTGV